MCWYIVREALILIARKPRNKQIFKWSDIKLTRTQVVDALIRQNKFRSYLEIGCQNDINFSAINIPHKIGVDPALGGTYRMTSDAFFAQNVEKFDLIFIDGMHTFEQVYKDFFNAYNVLNAGGVILFHDMLPTSWEQEMVPRMSRGWNGTVWKIAYELKRLLDNQFAIIVADQGLGIVFKNNEKPKLTPSDEDYVRAQNATYNDFLKDYTSFNLVSASEFEPLLLRKGFK
jgi:hypothetical protein